MPDDRTVSFGRFRLHPTQGLTRGRQEVRVTPKSLLVLLALIQRPGKIVTKEELFRSVWGDTVVSDAALTSCIQELRQALRDNARDPRYIETLHRRGFRFVATLSSEGQGARATSGAASGPIVGRDAALERLSSALTRAREGNRQIVFVTGEPGIGKTAMVEHFLASLGDDDTWRISRAGCVERYGAGEAYQPLLEAVTRLCRQPDGQDLVAILRRCAPTWLAQLPALQTPAELAALQRRTAGVTPERMLRELTDAVEAMATRVSIILCLEDLHWSDVSTLDWIAAFARRPERANVLLIATFRPGEATDPVRSPQAVVNGLRVKELCDEIALERLEQRDVAEYLTIRFPPAVDAQASHAELSRLVHRHTEGSPLFLVNVLTDLVARHALIARGDRWSVGDVFDAGTLGVPLDIRRAIEHQIDRLSDVERALLEVTSILAEPGTSAAIAAGAAITQSEVEATLDTLARRNLFVRYGPAVEWPDGTVSATFEFLHALYREVFSERLPPARSAQLHQMVGTRLEGAYGERVSEIAAELAVHFDAARDVPRAVVYLQCAAEADCRRSAHEGAQLHYRRALSLLERIPASEQRDEREIALLIGLGSVLMQLSGWGAREVEQAYLRARALCEKRGAGRQLFSVLWNLWVFYTARGRLDRAQALAGNLFELAGRSADPPQLMQAHHAHWTTLFTLGSLHEAEAHACEGMRLYERDHSGAQTHAYGSHDTGVCARVFQARSLVLQGQADRAVRLIEEAIKLARDCDHPFTLAFALTHGAAVHQERRDAATTAELATGARAIAREHSFSLLFAWATCFLGWSKAELADLQSGLAMIHEGVAAARETGSEMFLCHLLSLLAHAQVKAGLVAAARRSVDEGLAISARSGERTHVAELHRLRAELQLAASPGADGGSAAERDFRSAMEIATAQGARLLALRAALGLARHLRSSGKDPEARHLIAGARAAITTDSSLPELVEANALLASR